MPIAFACISPHPPIIVHEVGRGRERETQRTIAALEQVAQVMEQRSPQTAIIISPHGPIMPESFGVLSAPQAKADFSQWGAPNVSFTFHTDLEMVEAICREARQAHIPLEALAHWGEDLDWGCSVPLYYLRTGLAGARLVALTISFLSPREHYRLGQTVARASSGVDRRVALIASADMSHRLRHDGPYGFHPAGPVLDQQLREAVANWDVEHILNIDVQLRKQAGDDSVPSLSFLMGALSEKDVRPHILSYEGPFGVGYMVAWVEVMGER